MNETEGKKDNKFEDLINLYGLTLDQIKFYNTQIWQFPTALVTLNILGYRFLYKDDPLILGVMSIINFSLLYALWQHIKNSKAIIEANQEIEKQLRNEFKDAIPKFKAPWVRATTLIISILTFFNFSLFVSSLLVICSK